MGRERRYPLMSHTAVRSAVTRALVHVICGRSAWAAIANLKIKGGLSPPTLHSRAKYEFCKTHFKKMRFAKCLFSEITFTKARAPSALCLPRSFRAKMPAHYGAGYAAEIAAWWARTKAVSCHGYAFAAPKGVGLRAPNPRPHRKTPNSPVDTPKGLMWIYTVQPPINGISAIIRIPHYCEEFLLLL